jgi:hypothetical protein
MKLWEVCEGLKQIKSFAVEPWRVVEAQHLSSSRDLVDSLEQHDILEELLEESKPPIAKDNHYLIFSPFRYPPLKYGSRFGQLHEPSLWYGSLEIHTAFAEVAYYRLRFFNDCEGNLEYIETPVTAFKTYLSTTMGIDLTQAPFDLYSHEISHQSAYEYSQSLGTAMRHAHIEAFIYFSARAENEKNVGVYTPKAFVAKKGQYISNHQNWLCLAKNNLIEFTRLQFFKKERFVFSSEH